MRDAYIHPRETASFLTRAAYSVAALAVIFFRPGWCKSGRPIPQQDSRNHSLDVELRPSHIRSSTEKLDG